ncbi:hypothetical protein cce_0937 [Crocosphaera subtropica ATCC 51142]|uniref:DUF2281 domain-containing protein n=1 Tax=Crocosphaera subtropica (strain ATCC 51142 / BH68) TaxID=43989 RepID=B1WSV8_CROS5|nr:DUF2281 domain-containing protein [Crocosphaera subtropica]ACB50288.1 hypothetical protein cce_0937 [Crocosphaera subtropica ATCC 51142]
MSIEQFITQKIQKLPSSLKQEVLNFVEFLENKQVRESQEETRRTDEEKAWEVFLNLEKDSGYGNYTEEREAMFQDLTLDDILKEMDQELDKD